MKKVLRICLVVLFIYVNIITFLNYSYSVEEKLFDNKTTVTITKDSNVTNKQFVEQLEKIVNNNKSDIMFCTFDVNDSTEAKLVYSTFNNDDFISVSAIQKITKNDNTFYSNMNISNAEKIYCSDLFTKINIYNFKEITKYNLDSQKYYIASDTADSVMGDLQKAGYDVEILNEVAIYENISVVQYCFLPVFLICICILFYIFSLCKENAVKKINGYSSNNIFRNNFIGLIKNVFFFFILTAIVALTVIFCIFGLTVFDFILFSIKIYAIILAVIVVFSLLASLSTYFRNVILDIKGKNNNTEFFVVVFIAKLVFFVLLVCSVSTAYSNLSDIYKLSVQGKNVSNAMQNYVTLPIYENSKPVDESNITKQLTVMYNETNNSKNGIMIQCRDYCTDTDGTCFAEKYGQDEITVNENYLKINPIYDANNKLITADRLNKDKYCLLIPECKSDRQTEIRTRLLDIYENLTDNDISIILYKDDTVINTFNPNVNNADFGVIKNPIINIYNEKYLSWTLLSAFSGEEYFVQVSTDNAYKELYPSIKKAELEEHILETPYISNSFTDWINFYSNTIKFNLFEAAIYLLGLIVLIYQFCRLYCECFKERISVKILHGYNFINIHKIYMFAALIVYVLFAISACVLNELGIVRINLAILAVMCLLELAAFIITTKKYIKNNIAEFLKGK